MGVLLSSGKLWRKSFSYIAIVYKVIIHYCNPKTRLALSKWNKLPLTLREKHSKNTTEVKAPGLLSSSEKDIHEWKTNNLK